MADKDPAAVEAELYRLIMFLAHADTEPPASEIFRFRHDQLGHILRALEEPGAP